MVGWSEIKKEEKLLWQKSDSPEGWSGKASAVFPLFRLDCSVLTSLRSASVKSKKRYWLVVREPKLRRSDLFGEIDAKIRCVILR